MSPACYTSAAQDGGVVAAPCGACQSRRVNAGRGSSADETILVVVLLGGIAAMIVVLVAYQRRVERRLVGRDEMEVPIQSVARALVVLLPSMAAGPIACGVIASLTDPWARHHALAMTLASIGTGVLGLVIGIRATRGFRRIGALRWTRDRLELELADERRRVDLTRPFELDEATALGPQHMLLQVVIVTQGDVQLGFSYGLPMGRKGYGDRTLDAPVGPLVDGQARVIHERLRAPNDAPRVHAL